MRIAQLVLFVLLVIHLLWRGILPAFSTIDSDFANYYVPARMILEGKSLQHLYDDQWFQEEIYHYGMNQLGKFSPFPPTTAFVFLPIAWLSPIQALQMWTLINIAVLITSVLLLAKVTGKDWLWSSLLFLLSGHALVNNFRFGQFYLVLTFLILLAYFFWQRDQDSLSGILLGIGSAVKYFPVIFLTVHIIKKEWKVVLFFALALMSFFSLSIVFLGFGVNKQFLESSLPNHLLGNIQNPFSSAFQSWNSLLRNLFVYNQDLNPTPFVDASFLATIILIIVYLITASLVAITLRKTQEPHLQYALVSIAGLTLLPASATYHFLLLVIPVAFLLSRSSKDWDVVEKLIAITYATIGFLPYSFLRRFDFGGLLRLVAYPRLWLVTLLFILTLTLLHNKESLSQS